MGEQAPGGRLFSRRRRANVEGGRQHFHKVKVSPEEEAKLLQLAQKQGVTIPRLLVESALSLEASETPTERKQAIAELFAVHTLLARVSNLPTVWTNVSRYRTRSERFAPRVIHADSSSASFVGSAS